MNVNIAELIEIVLSAMQRRMRLIIWPLALFTCLAVVAIMFWPRVYITNALLMLQERQTSNPLGISGGATRRGRIKAAEIDALLKSERVLAGAIIDMNLDKKALLPRDIEGAVNSLRKQLSVGVVGSEFIEIELKQTEREGIGERLSIIMTRFFERLMSREDSMKTAREFALEQRQRDVVAVNKAIEDWVARAKSTGARGIPQNERLPLLVEKQKELEKSLIQSANSLLPGVVGLNALNHFIKDEIRVASSRPNRSEMPSTLRNERIMALRALEADFSRYQSIGQQIADIRIKNAQQLAKSLRSQKVSNPESDTLAELREEWKNLETRYAEAATQHTRHLENSRRGSGPSLTPFGLIAPDSIRIIDEPRDPILPSTSLLKIVLACLGAGIGLAAGFAALAEQLDDRIYDSRGLAALTGVDAVYRVHFNDSVDNTKVVALYSSPPKDGERSTITSGNGKASPADIVGHN